MNAPEARHERLRHVVSPSNPVLKIFRRALLDGTTRQGWLGMEGPLLLEEALNARSAATVQCVLVAESAAQKFQALLERVPREAELVSVSDRMFEQIAATQTPQGVAALVEIRPPDFDAILLRRGVVLLIACGIQDPGNIGTIVRSGQALGASALITLREPTKPMLTEAAAAGFYQPSEPDEKHIKVGRDGGVRYPRLQILTIAELLAGKKLEYPAHRVETFAKAERKTKHDQEELFHNQ